MACGRVRVRCADGSGLFDHLSSAIVLDLTESLQRHGSFEVLIDEYQRAGPACAATMTALMNHPPDSSAVGGERAHRRRFAVVGPQ